MERGEGTAAAPRGDAEWPGRAGVFGSGWLMLVQSSAAAPGGVSFENIIVKHWNSPGSEFKPGRALRKGNAARDGRQPN